MSEDTTRRRYLVASGVVGATLLAGCANVGSGAGTSTTEAMGDDTSETTDSMSETTESMDDGMSETTESMDDGEMSETTESMDDGEMSETTDDGMMATEFTVRVENVSTADTLQTMGDSKSAPLSPVAYAVFGEDGRLFAEGESASVGLEALAEDGSPAKLVEELSMSATTADAAAVPDGDDDPAPIGPGGAYSFTVEAHAGQSLSLATMFVQSNDLFYAPAGAGIPLFDGGEPIHGDVTDLVHLWDAGTEENEEPGVGLNQAPRQSGSDTGPSENEPVRRVEDVEDGYDYPDVADVVSVTVTPGGMDG